MLVEPGRILWLDVLLPASDPLWDDDVARAFLWLGEAWQTALASLDVPAQVHRGGLCTTSWSRLVCFGGLGTGEGRRAADAIDPRRYRHVGPKPQSREAALIMLADGVEASVRSLESRDEPAIRAMVSRIITERMEDGQFDECDLTLRDLELIREAFVGQLLGMYHSRIAYPQNTVVELESRRAAAGGGSSGGSGSSGAAS